MENKNHATRWLDGEISSGKLVHLEGIPFAQGEHLLGSVWQAFSEKAYALDAALKSQVEVSKKFSEMAKAGDTLHVVKDDEKNEAMRAAVYQECRSLLRFHLLSCIDRTGAAV